MCIPTNDHDRSCTCITDGSANFTADYSKVLDWLNTNEHIDGAPNMDSIKTSNIITGGQGFGIMQSLKEPIVSTGEKETSFVEESQIPGFHQLKTAQCTDIVTGVRKTHINSLDFHEKRLNSMKFFTSSPVNIRPRAGSMSSSQNSLPASLAGSPPKSEIIETPLNMDVHLSRDSLSMPKLDARRAREPGPQDTMSPPPSQYEGVSSVWKKMSRHRIGQRDMNVLAPVSL